MAASPITAFKGFAESWGRYTVGDQGVQLTKRWTTAGINLGSIIASGRNGQGLKLVFGDQITRTMWHEARWCTVFSAQISTSGIFGARLFALQNCSQLLFELFINPDGTISLHGNGSSQIIATSSFALHSGGSYSFETDVVFSGTSNITVTASLWVNGALLLSGSIATGINQSSLPSNTATANRIFLEPGVAVPGFTVFDDFVTHNAGGVLITGPIGDVRVMPVFPNGDTGVADFTPNSGAVSFDRVKEHGPDDDSTYIEGGVVGNKTILDWDDIPGFSGTIPFVQSSLYLRKTAEGSRAARFVTGASGTESNSDDFYLGDNYVYYEDFGQEADPATSLAWTRAGFNAKQFGIEITV